MISESSSRANPIGKEAHKETMMPTSVRGRKSSSTQVDSELDNLSEGTPTMFCTDDEYSSEEEEEFDSDEEEEEEDEEWNERIRILQDSRQLKKIATMFLHPEKPVESDGFASARCYFERPSAPERLSVEEAEEQFQIQEDSKALKKLAVDYAHPELPVKASPSAGARCYFIRASAPEQMSSKEAEEAERILEEVQLLKKAAHDYLHPEAPVVASATAFGRNYFDRASAPEQEDPEEAEERARILAEAKAFKKLAIDYMHPELPVSTTDPFATGRNYFSRPSAPEQEDGEDIEERTRALEDAKTLKKLAVDYMHPEMPVRAADSALFGRNYFSRASAPEEEDSEEAEERARVLAEAKAFKKLAVDYMHPELPVVTTDPFATGRNYFSRPSALEQEDEADIEERTRALEDAKALKKLAVDYMHPEMPVCASDPTLFGRNYFNRASAPEEEDSEEAEERARILADALAFKKLAVDYMHPELPVATSDACATGRNYFSRPSAPAQEDDEDTEEHTRILEDLKALKQAASDYLHPERPVKFADPALFGRNYFDRASAPQAEDVEEAEERARILTEAKAFKKLAVDYMHPELPVVTSDACVTGRNYFSRPSAAEQEDDEDIEERTRALEDAKALKKLAVDYMHPEMPVKAADPALFGRNYFGRASAPEEEDLEEAEERARILAEAKAFKKLAIDYMHPELPVVTSDACATGRNYFSRPSAPQQDEDAEELARILEDAKALKKLAIDYMHPEMPVKAVDPTLFGRNYFNRASAPEQEDADEAEERARVLAEAKAFKKLAVDYLHPELSVSVTDGTARARSFFNRPSAAGYHSEMIHTEGVAHNELVHPGVAHEQHDHHFIMGHDLVHDDHQHYRYNQDHHGDHQSHYSHHSQSDHFDMDEDIFHDMRHSFNHGQPSKPDGTEHLEGVEEEEEGKLSRSPSSIMLFEGEAY